ncbi:MAG: monooxygenase [Rhodospirillales bacterium]|nr:monooxygenase [Rhodospirillales bacterium]
MPNPQVLIVGAGPVGLTLAAELVRYGVAVRIVEKAAQRTDKSKALILWSRTLELLDRAGCTETFVAAGHRIEAANITAGNKRIGHIRFDALDSPYPYALSLPQSETERLLEAHLARLGLAPEREVELTDFTERDNGVQATLRHRDGRDEQVEADWLVGCDGAHSTVRHKLGLSFLGSTMQSDWLLADTHVAGTDFPDSEIATYWHEDGVLAVFPITPGRYRIVADIGASVGPSPADPTLDQVQAIVDRRGPGGLTVSDPVWLAGFRINERKVADYRTRRSFLAGDAAHIHSPAGGQGMNTGMQDAFNLAWKLALVCRGTCSDGALLDSYSIERSAVGERVLKAAGRLTSVAVLKNHAAQTVRNLVGGLVLGLAPVRRAMSDTMSELSIAYDESPLNGPGARGLDGPAPGERARPVAGQTPIGAGDAPRFALCAAATEAAQHVLQAHPHLLEPSLRAPLGEGGMWLVRPDGYTALAVKDGEYRAVTDYLDALR